MKVYTKTGDEGTTGLIGGTRVPKDHVRIEAYGSVDELNAHIGFLRDQEGMKSYQERLVQIQEQLFTMGSHLANDPEKSKMKLPEFLDEFTHDLEKDIDSMEEELPAMTNFVLPGGHPSISTCHVARCVCRRAERATISLNRSSSVQTEILVYLNRLSDYLFVLSRKFAQDLGVEETPWKPRG